MLNNVLYHYPFSSEYEQAKDFVTNDLSFDKNKDVNLFEVTIRVLGGLLSSYHLTGEDVFKAKAVSTELHSVSRSVSMDNIEISLRPFSSLFVLFVLLVRSKVVQHCIRVVVSTIHCIPFPSKTQLLTTSCVIISLENSTY